MNGGALSLVRWHVVISYFMGKESTPCNLTKAEKMGDGANGSRRLKQDSLTRVTCFLSASFSFLYFDYY
ncbi:hypothetical protein VNO78_02356 [Psophocarpus tetragonolobus]|uniref:Uncharacterized protein n=1 Tax=Psophocarpus tetragonolobus TaxID=3891 RepID=A0AAN9T1C1_PSOTE